MGQTQIARWSRPLVTVHGTVLDLGAAKREQQGRCPRRTSEWLNVRTGELLPAACWASSCPRCFAVQVARKSVAIRYAQPEWLLTATAVGDDWGVVRRQFKAFLRRIRDSGCRPELAWTVECATNGPSHHLHALGWGGLSRTHEQLREHSLAVGWGRQVDLRTVSSDQTAGYVMKQAINSEGQLDHFLTMNGRRLLHTTARFWRRPDGSHIKGGVRAVLEEARRNQPAKWNRGLHLDLSAPGDLPRKG